MMAHSKKALSITGHAAVEPPCNHEVVGSTPTGGLSILLDAARRREVL